MIGTIIIIVVVVVVLAVALGGIAVSRSRRRTGGTTPPTPPAAPPTPPPQAPPKPAAEPEAPVRAAPVAAPRAPEPEAPGAPPSYRSRLGGVRGLFSGAVAALRSGRIDESHLGVPGGGADPGRRRRQHDERTPRRAAGEGADQGDQAAGTTCWRPWARRFASCSTPSGRGRCVSMAGRTTPTSGCSSG